MKYRTIGSSGISVSELCLGTMTFGTPVAENEAIEIVRAAVDIGINFIDTANIYEGYTRVVGSAGGIGEAILGRALKENRNQVVLATKVGMKVGSGKDDQGLGRTHILREIDRSLKKLASDTIDIYYMHKPDPDTPLDESISTFRDLIKDGKIRAWGISNFSADEVRILLDLCDSGGYPRPIIVQPAYSLLNRQAEESLLPLCEREGLCAVPYQVLQDSRQKEKPEWTTPLSDSVFDQLEALDKDAGSLGRTLMEHALRELLSRKPVVSVLVGVKDSKQLEMLARTVD